MISMTSLASTWIWDIIMRPHVAVVFELMRHAGSIPRYSKLTIYPILSTVVLLLKTLSTALGTEPRSLSTMT